MTGPEGLERGLKTASDSLLATLDELYALENTKRELTPGSREFVELAGRIEQLARSVLTETRRQEAFAQRAERSRGTPDEVDRPLEDVPPRPIQIILAEWRQAERLQAGVENPSPAYDQLQADIRRLRREYRRATELARQRNGE